MVMLLYLMTWKLFVINLLEIGQCLFICQLIYKNLSQSSLKAQNIIKMSLVLNDLEVVRHKSPGDRSVFVHMPVDLQKSK